MRIRENALSRGISQALTIALAGTSVPAFSQVLEEIVVTAQKRAESLQGVPISVAAVTGEKIANTGIRNLRDAIQLVPNVTIVGTEIGDSINIRGIQSGNQAGFEQSVATFVDGVYRGRGTQSRFSFLDVERLEVLRGPQGVLFGKNVVAGALSITSAKPTDEFGGNAKVLYNVDLDETEVTAAVSGPVSDTLRARVSLLSREMEEGWVNNTRYNQDEPQRDEMAARLSLDWDPGESTNVAFKLERSEWDNFGVPWEIIVPGPLAALAPLGQETSINGITAVGTFPLAPDPNQELGSSQLFEGDTTEVVLTLNHSFDGGGDLTAIAASSAYDFSRSVDADVSLLDVLNFNDEEDFEQNTFELRFASEQGGTFEYIVGGFYLDSDLVAEGNTPLGVAAVDSAVSGGCAAGGGSTAPFVPGVDDPNIAAARSAINNAALGTSGATANACALATLTGPLVSTGINGFNRYVKLDQSTETWAVFGQVSWNLSDSLSSTIGIRYNDEQKTATHQSVVANYGVDSKTPSTNPLAFALAGILGEYTPHNFDDLERSEDDWTWSVNLQWDFSEQGMAYATASTGFKAGGFNSFYLDLVPDPSKIEFEEEKVLTLELGTKLSLLDGASEINVAVFRSEYTDLQAAVFSGSTTFNVDNAAEATTQGIEIDSRWQLSDSLMLSASFGWVDFEFQEFPNQACTSAQFEAFRESVWAGGSNPLAAFLTNADCAQAGINNLAGRTSAQTPELSGVFSLDYRRPLNDGLTLGIGADVVYRDESYRQDDLDENALDDASTTLNARVRLSFISGWTLMLLGNNLTDEEIFSMGQDIPLASGAHFVQTVRPRTFALSASYEF